KELAGCKASVKLVLVDACRNDPAAGRGGIDGGTAVNTPTGIGVLMSCAGGQQSWESKDFGGGHGAFFHNVITGLKEIKRNDRGELTWSRLTEYVTAKVSTDVPAIIKDGASQDPNEVSNLKGPSPVLLLNASFVRDDKEK